MKGKKLLAIAFITMMSAVLAGSQIGSVSPNVGETFQFIACDQPAVQGADLIPCSLKFNGLGEITVSVKNRGTEGINMPNDLGRPARRGTTPSGPPIVLSLYMQNQLIVSLTQPALGAGQTRAITTQIPSNYSTPGCGAERALKLVIDPNNQHAEQSENNNTALRAAAKVPCPDLAIKSIERDYEGLVGETYRVKVTVINQGDAPSPVNEAWATSLPGTPWPVNGWPALVPTQQIRALEPGETMSFKVGGSVLSSNRTAIRIMLDRHSQIAELDESNNAKDERL